MSCKITINSPNNKTIFSKKVFIFSQFPSFPSFPSLPSSASFPSFSLFSSTCVVGWRPGSNHASPGRPSSAFPSSFSSSRLLSLLSSLLLHMCRRLEAPAPTMRPPSSSRHPSSAFPSSSSRLNYHPSPRSILKSNHHIAVTQILINFTIG